MRDLVRALEALKLKINLTFNDELAQMEPNFDDSIVGFNKAWDALTPLLAEAILKAKKGISPPAPAAMAEAQWELIRAVKEQWGRDLETNAYSRDELKGVEYVLQTMERIASHPSAMAEAKGEDATWHDVHGFLSGCRESGKDLGVTAKALLIAFHITRRASGAQGEGNG